MAPSQRLPVSIICLIGLWYSPGHDSVVFFSPNLHPPITLQEHQYALRYLLNFKPGRFRCSCWRPPWQLHLIRILVHSVFFFFSVLWDRTRWSNNYRVDLSLSYSSICFRSAISRVFHTVKFNRKYEESVTVTVGFKSQPSLLLSVSHLKKGMNPCFLAIYW